jgi:hypothetical protein
MSQGITEDKRQALRTDRLLHRSVYCDVVSQLKYWR